MQSVLQGRETLVLFPTGGGKSLCYQLPATVLPGLTLVISPLVALMQDQVAALNDRGIPATFVNSSISRYEVEQRLVNARNGMYKLLYLAPERLGSTLWEAELPKLDINLVAIDEAHCISEWGHDFRPSYRDIRPMLEPVADSVRWLALTATATPEVREDITQNLQFENPVVISRGFERSNLKWWVKQTNRKDRDLLRIINRGGGAGLVYGGTRKNCERLAGLLQERGLSAKAYHAGMPAEERRTIQQDWIANRIRIVVATNAFGMGIDKEDCRFVVHYDMPFSPEAYYQEAGRAGRDGQESYPILLYREADYHRSRKRIEDAHPELEQLQRLYDVLADSLDLAIGSEMEGLKPVSVEALQTRADMPRKTVRAGLKTLDQTGVIQLVQQAEPQIGIHFVAGEAYLRQFLQEVSNRKKKEFVDTLYRHFGADAFDGMVFLGIDYLKGKMDIRYNSLVKGLEVLAREQMLRYEMRGEHPLVGLTEPRQKQVPLGRERLDRHRGMLLKKLDYMRGYAETSVCRSRYLRVYFGEKKVPRNCGFCDNCLKKKSEGQQMLEAEHLQKVSSLLQERKMTVGELQQATGWNSRFLRRVLGLLQKEGKIGNDAGDESRFYWVE